MQDEGTTGAAEASEARGGEGERGEEVSGPLRWRWPLGLFLATVASTFYVGASQVLGEHPRSVVTRAGRAVLARSPDEVYAALRPEGLAAAWRGTLAALATGWVFAVPLLGILLCHEFGHYLMARRHRVPASLPMFIPFPNVFGTMGAVISMKGRIRTRDALVDIGAAGPLAGLAVAVPVTVLGLALSEVRRVSGLTNVLVEGDSLLYVALKLLVWGRLAPGYDVWLHPVAFAGWAGFFVTMMNLLPIGQLDGGHVAYALFGERQDRWSRWFVAGLFAMAAGVAVWVVAVTPRSKLDGTAFTPAMIWALWALLSRGVMKLSGDRHPPTGDEPLSPWRRRVAVVSLVCFVLLFMPVPIRLV